jgi:hypothetical protein
MWTGGKEEREGGAVGGRKGKREGGKKGNSDLKLT